MADQVEWNLPEHDKVVEEPYIRQVIEGLQGKNTPPLTFTQTLTVEGLATLAQLLVPGESTFNGTVQVNGDLGVDGDLDVTGALTTETLSVSGVSTFADAATFTSNVTVEGNTVLGNAAGDTLTVGATATFSAPVTFSGGITLSSLSLSGTLNVDGNTTLGNASGDTTVVTGGFTAQATGGASKQIVTDPANGRTIIGNSTPLTSASNDTFTVIGQSYFAPASASDNAIQMRRSSASTTGWSLGVNSAGGMSIRDTADAEVVKFGTAASGTQMTVQDDLTVVGNVSADFVETAGGDINGPLDILATSGTFDWQNSGNSRLKIDSTGVGFFGSAPIAKPTVVGAKAGNVALENLLEELANLGLITDSTTA